MRGNAELARAGREALAGARPSSSARSTSGECSRTSSGHVERVHEVPPGVDVDEFGPAQPRRGAAAAARRGPPRPAESRQRERATPGRGQRGAAGRVLRRRRADGPLLREAALQQGRPRPLRGPPRRRRPRRGRRLRRLSRRARGAWRPPRTLFTGPLEHRHLVNLVPLTDVTVVPSIFPEAFGMVAAEAAAGGSPPLVARHSGLAEIAAGLEAEYPPSTATWQLRDRRRARARRQAAASWRSRRTSGAGSEAARRAAVSAGAGRASRTGSSSPFNRLPGWETSAARPEEQLRVAREQFEAAATSRSPSRRSSRSSTPRRSR